MAWQADQLSFLMCDCPVHVELSARTHFGNVRRYGALHCRHYAMFASGFRCTSAAVLTRDSRLRTAARTLSSVLPYPP